MMYSGIFLEEEVKKFCGRNSLDEGQVWQIINKKYIEEFGRNICWEKNQFEKENHTGDIPMAEWLAKTETIHGAIYILKGLQNCINNGWELE